MNTQSFEEITGFDDAARMAHVELHGNKGKAYLPTEEVEVKTQDGKIKKKFKILDATASEFHQEMHHVMASYVVPNDTEGLITATEITATDLVFPPLVTKGEDLKRCIEKKLYTFPEKAMLLFKPQPKKSPSSQRSRGRAKKRKSEGTQHHFMRIDSDGNLMGKLLKMTSSPEFKTFLKDVAKKAKQEGMPLWGYALAMPELNAGQQRSRSVPVYHPNSRRELDREAVMADLRQTAVSHIEEILGKRGQIYYPGSEEIMAEYHKFMAKRPPPAEEKKAEPATQQDNQCPVEEEEDPDTQQDDQLHDEGEQAVQAEDAASSEDAAPVGDGQQAVNWTEQTSHTEGTGISDKTIADFRDWLRFSLKWTVTTEEIKRVINQRFLIVGTGLIAVDEAHKGIKRADLEHWVSLRELLKRNKGKDKKKDEDMTPAELEAERIRMLEEKANAFRRVAPIIRNITTVPAKAKKFEQNENDYTRFIIVQQPLRRSYGRLFHSVNYIDEDTPDKQPRYVVYVDLTYENTCATMADEKDIEYMPTHRVTDVSNPVWEPTLKKIFPQTRDIPNYYKGLYNTLQLSQYRLFLLTIKHNEAHCTSNLFSNKDAPNLVQDLRVVVKKSPTIYMLARTADFEKRIDGLTQQFGNLARSNPLNEYFVEPLNPSLT